MKNKWVGMVIVGIIIILSLVASIFLVKTPISLDDVKTMNMKVEDQQTDFTITTASSMENSWGYDYDMFDKELYITVYQVSRFNPYRIKTDIHFQLDKGYNEISRIYLKSGSLSKLVWIDPNILQNGLMSEEEKALHNITTRADVLITEQLAINRYKAKVVSVIESTVDWEEKAKGEVIIVLDWAADDITPLNVGDTYSISCDFSGEEMRIPEGSYIDYPREYT